MSNPTLLFLGSPDFAVPALYKLIDAGYSILAVVTQPDKPVGRLQKLAASPVKKLALEHGITVLAPASWKKDENIARQIKDLAPDLAVVVAYGKIIPKTILDIPKYGTINIHPSLLPKYRGPSPIQAAILAGDKETGVSIMLLDEEMDHGPILAVEKVKISPDETAGVLHDKLAELGAEMLLKVIPEFVAGKISPVAQDHEKATFCKIISREDGQIDWRKSAAEIERQFRAFFPWPGVFTFWLGRRIKILELEVADAPSERSAGQVYLDGGELKVACGKGSVILKKLQIEGKKEMDAKEFLRGHGSIVGSLLV